MTDNYLSPFPFYWVAALGLIVLTWVASFRAQKARRTAWRAFSISLAISPALIIGGGGHAGMGMTVIPMFALLLLGFQYPLALVFALFNAIQFLVVWALVKGLLVAAGGSAGKR